MKVAIYIPYVPDGNTIPSLGPLYICAVLEKDGFEVFLFDARIDNWAFDKLLAFKPDVVGISTATSSYLRGLSIAKKIKETFSEIPVIFGGAHPTILPNEVINEPCVDYVIIGEGEYGFLELCKRFRDRNISHSSLISIKNLVFKEKGEQIFTERGQFLSNEELDSLPFPAFHRMDIKTYFAKPQIHGLFNKGKRILPIISTRGCPNRCTFCCRIMGDRIRSRSVDSVMSEIRYLVDNYGIDEIYFEDDNFTILKERALSILDRMASFKQSVYLKFANGIRADLVNGEILKAMKKANVYSVSMGVESGSTKTLKKMKKNLNLEKAKENILLAKSMGFLVGSNCIIGYPGETVDDIEYSLNFFFSLPLDSMAIVNLVPFPGTEVREICEKEGYLTEEALDWNNYYFSINNPIPLIESPQLPKKELIKLVHKAYKRMYMRPSWILKSLKYLTIKQVIQGAYLMFPKLDNRGHEINE